MPSRSLTFLATIGLCLLGSALSLEAQASQRRAAGLTELVRAADATVLGHTVRTRSYWQGTRIVTSARIAIDELWSGTVAGANEIEVVTLGGAVGEWGQRVDGAAEFSPYGRMVLHLKRRAEDYTPVRMAEGVWYVDGLWGDQHQVRQQESANVVGQARQQGGQRGLGAKLGVLPLPASTPPTLGWLREAVAAAGREQGALP